MLHNTEIVHRSYDCRLDRDIDIRHLRTVSHESNGNLLGLGATFLIARDVVAFAALP